MEINYFMIGLLIFMTWIVVYSIVHRICKCVETKEMYRAFGSCLSGHIIKDPETFSKLIKQSIVSKE